MGAIGSISTTKANMGGTYSVTVDAAITPAQNETVYQHSFPRADILDAQGIVLASFALSNNGTTWEGAGDTTDEPVKVKVFAKFVSAAVQKEQGL